MTLRFVLSGLRALDSNGDPLPGALLYAYQAGTTTPQDTFSDSALATANANPVVADAGGLFGDIFLSSTTYKFVLKDSGGSTIKTWDNYDAAFAVLGATQAQVDARTATDVYLAPSTVADGLGLQGAAIAAASTLTLPTVGDYFSVTGTGVTITALSERTAGRKVTLRFAASNTIQNSASLLCPGGVYLAMVADDVVTLVSEGAGIWRVVSIATTALGSVTSGGLLRGYLGGMTLSNDGVSPNTKVDVAAGSWADDGNTRVMTNTAGTLDFSITGANGLADADVALAASTWYNVFAIGKADGTTALFAATSASPTLPTGYTLKRRLGSVKTDASSHLLAFSQNGDEFYWAASVLDVSVSSANLSSAVLYTLSVPIGVKVGVIFNFLMNEAVNNAEMYFSSPDQNDEAASLSAAPLSMSPFTTASNNFFGHINNLRTNTSAQIRARGYASSTSTALKIATLGWVDRRGKDD